MNAEASRIRSVTALMVLALALVGAGIARVAVLERESITRRPHVDAAMLEALGKVAAEPGVLRVDDGRVVVADAGKLKIACTRYSISSSSFERRLDFFEPQGGGGFRLDPSAARQVNPRLAIARGGIVRGRILDREGLLLAGPDPAHSGPLEEARRIYLLGPAGLPLIGFSHPSFGRRGLEATLDDWLAGRNTGSLAAKAERRWERERRGADIELTLDGRLQREAFAFLDGRRGAAVLLSVPDFEVLVATSSPSFDPATRDGSKWKAAERDAAVPMSDRALRESYFPGSTFKVAVASAWLSASDDELRAFSTTCRGGRHARLRIGEHGAEVHGRVDLAEGMAVSCNHLFGELAVEQGAAMLPTLQALRFNSRLELGGLPDVTPVLTAHAVAFAALNAEGSGGAREAADPWDALEERRALALALSAGAEATPGERPDPRQPMAGASPGWFLEHPGVTAQGGIGQNVVRATPMHMAALAAMVASEGTWREPRLVRAIRNPSDDGEALSLQPLASQDAERVLPRPAARELASMMRAVMTRGTGKGVMRRAGVSGFTMGGKTGTAETGVEPGPGVDPETLRPHSWFIGFAPAEEPRYAVAVIIENGGAGSAVAAPVAARLLASALAKDEASRAQEGRR